MNKLIQCLKISVIFLVLSTGLCLAEDIYVTGVTNITMRTGPGTEHKIVAMLKSGTKLEIVRYGKDWSQVKTLGGRSGWVLSRFLTQKVPDALLVEKLETENGKLKTKVQSLETENRKLTVENAALVQVEQKYKKLKQESADFLELDARYKEMIQQSEAQKKKIESLENEMNNEANLWFVIGPGVFIVGLIFGLSTRKKRKSSLL